YIAFMDGIVMGGGMGISQGGTLRIVTERTKMAMPETLIGLFPDVGGGYFLSRCPGHVGEWLALTGHAIAAGDAIRFALADGYLPAERQQAVWDGLAQGTFASGAEAEAWVRSQLAPAPQAQTTALDEIEHFFSLDSVPAIIRALEAAGGEFAQHTATALRARSPLMLHVVLEQIRRARGLPLADDLRMERDMVRHCFYLRPGQSETIEGIRALAVDKDHSPRWSPAHIEDVTDAMWQAFFESPWPAYAHPLAHLQD
ncbi:MAG: 3-hydroxyisobutyryl-CoA hydrolase, partial [Comamonas sp.]